MKIEDKINSARKLINDLGNAISDYVNVSPEVFEDPILVEKIKDFRLIYDRNTEKLKDLCGISYATMQNSILNGILADFAESYKILSTSLIFKIESSKYQEASRLQIIYEQVKDLQDIFANFNELLDYEESNLYEISSQSYKMVSQTQDNLEYTPSKELNMCTSHLEKGDSVQTQHDSLKLEEVLKQCIDTSAKSYEICYKYATKLEIILRDLCQKIQSKADRLSKSSKDKSINSLVNKIRVLISEMLDDSLEELRKSLQTKQKHCAHYTIALFGRTKAGKSTIRETLGHGDGNTIGKGGQRTTREIGEYWWRGLRLIDTPGIEAYKGDEDTDRALDAIDQSDMVLFLVSSDAVQPGEFEIMSKLKQSYKKHFAVVMNWKKRLNSMDDIEDFLEEGQDFFSKIKKQELHSHINNNAKKYFGMNSIDIVDIHARAGFLSLKNEYQSVAHELWNLSRLEKVHELISIDILEYGQERRISTFFDGTNKFFESVKEELLKIEKIIGGELQKQYEQKQKMNQVFENAIKDGNRKIDIEFNKIFSQFQQRICRFVDNSVGSKTADSEWNQLIRDYQEKLRATAQQLFKEIQIDLKNQIEELEKEQRYDSTAFNFDFHVSCFEQGKTGEYLKNFSLLLGGVAAAAFIAANWWNPAGWVVGAGWIATGISAIARFFSGGIRNDEKKEFEQKRQNLKNQIIKEASKIQGDTTQKCKEEITKRLNATQQKALNSLDPVIDCFTKIKNDVTMSMNKVQNLIQELESRQNEMKKN